MSATDGLFVQLEWLGPSERLLKFFKEHNVVYVGDLATKTEVELFSHLDFSKRMLEEARYLLGYNGFGLGMNLPGWPPPNVAERSGRLVAIWRLPPPTFRG
jgi:DNA-directed RNA polymerase subunit alpha